MAVSAGDQVHIQIQANANSAQWRWQVGNGQTESGRSIQSTLAGQLLQPVHQHNPKENPVLSVEGEIDLFILRMMDGSATVEEITQQVLARFPLQFSSFEEALRQAQLVVNYYGHRANGQSPTDGAIPEEIVWKSSKLTAKEV